MMLRRILLKTSGVILTKNRSISRYQTPQFSRMKITVKSKDNAPDYKYTVQIKNNKDNEEEMHRFGDSTNNYTTNLFFRKEDLDEKDELKLFMVLRKSNGTTEMTDLSMDTSKKTDVRQWQNGSTDLEIITRIDKEPDVTFRDIKQLCRKEEEFVTKRKRFVYNNMIKNNRLQKSLEGKDESVVPRIAIIGSGGGLRATIGMSGAVLGLNSLGILDYTMYIAGLSGSQWYLMALYANDQTLDPFRLQRRILVTIPKCSRIENQYNVWGKSSFNLRNALLTADAILGEQYNVKWSKQRQKLEEGYAPLPFIAALLVDDNSEIQDDQEWIELSPYEVFIPSIGAAIDMENFGDTFYGGFVANETTNIDSIGMLQDRCCNGHAEAEIDKPSGGKWYQFCRVMKGWMRSKFNSSHHNLLLKMPNWLYGMISIEPPMNETDSHSDIFNVANRTMHLVDASRVFNSPYPVVLNPSRKVDIILSFDFSYRGKDTNWPFEELEKVSEWAKQRRIPFPELDSQLKEIRSKWPERGNFEQVYVFPGGDDSPTIVHFVMKEDLYASSGYPDFQMLPKYATDRVVYSEEEISSLAQVMMSNVLMHKEKILDAILSKIKKSE